MASTSPRSRSSSPLATNRAGTFAPNHAEAVHRWYPYLEGYAAAFVAGLLDEFAPRARTGAGAAAAVRVYDPFAGTGTTVTVAADRGLRAGYSEINPFMRLVVEAKTNGRRALAGDPRGPTRLAAYLAAVTRQAQTCRPHAAAAVAAAAAAQRAAFGERAFFAGTRLVEIVALKEAIAAVPAPAPAYRDLAHVALGAIAVPCSEMRRAGDLRYRTAKERLPAGFSVLAAFAAKRDELVADVQATPAPRRAVTLDDRSALGPGGAAGDVDVVLTSPPYLNGTNYFRNTKLELWLTGGLGHERELGAFRDLALAAGINDVSRRGRRPATGAAAIPAVERVARRLDEVAYDVRIPELVRRYFSDAALWLANVHRRLRPGGVALIDIGDSRFAGVHVATDTLLAAVAERCGFADDIAVRPVRARKSKDGTPLRQVLLVLRKPSSRARKPSSASPRHVGQREYRTAARDFGRALPHLAAPYAARNWGHGLHSLCSYQGKLKPAIAHFLVARFTKPGDRVLDPMSGAGTIPLEAFLQGRHAIGNDLQELAFCVTRAKVERGSDDDVRRVRDALLAWVTRRAPRQDPHAYADFGLNGRLPDYFHPDTYREVLAAREYVRARPCPTWAEAVVFACLLHVLHGNRPYALSRRSHPVTPFRPTGPTAPRPLAPRLTAKLERTLALPIPAAAITGAATNLPFAALSLDAPVDAVITSPPFAASTRFWSSNWLRLWFAGWEPADFGSRRAAFLEEQQRRSLDAYHDFFAAAARWLRPGGRLLLHVGRTPTCDMAAELSQRAGAAFEHVHTVDEAVAGRETFGIRDQGATAAHQYVFFQRANH